MEDYLKDYPAVLNIPEVAEILGVTPATVRRHIKEDHIPNIKIGRLIRIPKDSLISFLHSEKMSDTMRKEEET